MSKRTVQKALRIPVSRRLSPPPDIHSRVIERMQGLMMEVLNGSQLDARSVFVLDYISAVLDFHKTVDKKEKDAFLNQISLNEERGYGYGFKKEELSSLNFLVLQAKVNGQLSLLEQRIKKKESQ